MHQTLKLSSLKVKLVLNCPSKTVSCNFPDLTDTQSRLILRIEVRENQRREDFASETIHMSTETDYVNTHCLYRNDTIPAAAKTLLVCVCTDVPTDVKIKLAMYFRF